LAAEKRAVAATQVAPPRTFVRANFSITNQSTCRAPHDGFPARPMTAANPPQVALRKSCLRRL
jgi:hypothetical protein